MSVRTRFEEELDQLKQEIVILAERVEKAYEDVIQAVRVKDTFMMDEIILNDKNINNMELAINENATYLIAKQQPVASDLRKIIVSLKVSSDLERMGDLAVDIAKVGKRLTKNDEGNKEFELELLKIADKVKTMIGPVIEAFKETDILSAQKVAAKDDEIDADYGRFVKSIFTVLNDNSENVEQLTQFAFIARYIERIGDYCTNISEWIIYEVTGERLDLN